MAYIECRNPDYWGSRCISLYADGGQEILTPLEARQLANELIEAANIIDNRNTKSNN